MNRADVITPAIGNVRLALGQEQEVVSSARGDGLEQSERRAIEKRFRQRLVLDETLAEFFRA